MDIFKFDNPTAPTKMESGIIVNNLTSKMWIERYREAGEFTFVGDASMNLKEQLPIGSFISHVDTAEVMIVENHEISDEEGKEPEIVITGRGFETEGEQRIVGINKNYPTVTAPSDYVLASGYTWAQAVTLISDHILAANLLDDNNAIPYVSVSHDVAGVGVTAARIVKLGDLYKRLLELLEIDNLGQKIVRPGPWSPLGGASPNLAWVIHKGVDRTSEIIFSYHTGEIERADYLWSNKKRKNAAIVTGRWVETIVTGTETEYARRWMPVDATDVDNSYSVAPVGGDLTAVLAAMHERGVEALAAQKDISLTKAEVSKSATNAKYRTDFNVGDLVTIDGNYNESSSMRVSEYVEIEDESGMRGYPTLTMD